MSTVTAAYYQSGETVTLSDQVYQATEVDSYGVYVTDSGVLNLSNSTVIKSGDTTSDDNASFYGLNSGILATDGATINLTDCIISTTGDGANAVFATGEGSVVNMSGGTIVTTADFAHGIDATYTATFTADNVNIVTQGAHCAAVATDRGTGIMTFTNGTATTYGWHSPGLYSTGTVTAIGSTITAVGAEGGAIEGLNSLTITDCDLTATLDHGIIVYQSESGDAETGTATVTMSGGTFNVAEGPVFYITNTDSVISISGVEITNPAGVIIKASAGDWGDEGANGGIVAFTADSQTLVGDLVVDSISTADVTLQNSSVLTGAINAENTAESMALTLDASSTWSVTADSYLSSLVDADTTLVNIDDNGYTIYYDSSLSANEWLNSETYTLADGGKLTPQ